MKSRRDRRRVFHRPPVDRPVFHKYLGAPSTNIWGRPPAKTTNIWGRTHEYPGARPPRNSNVRKGFRTHPSSKPYIQNLEVAVVGTPLAAEKERP